MVQRGKPCCQIKACVCIESNKWKMFAVKHTRGSLSMMFRRSVISAPFCLIRHIWSFPRFCKQVLSYCLVRKVLLPKIAVQHWLRKTGCFLKFFLISPHKANDFSHQIPYAKPTSQNLCQVTNTIPSWTFSTSCVELLLREPISTNKRTQLIDGDWWLWSVGQVGIWSGRAVPTLKDTV